jgi:hypothetical protein
VDKAFDSFLLYLRLLPLRFAFRKIFGQDVVADNRYYQKVQLI